MPMVEDQYPSQPVDRRVFRDEIREQLIEDILSGRLPPGTRIVETRLAQQFGVSQAPVREALRDLAVFGFVVNSPFRGTQVRQISPEELLEIYPIRAALEGVAARAAATRIDDAGLRRLEELIDTMREAASRDDHRAQAGADATYPTGRSAGATPFGGSPASGMSSEAATRRYCRPSISYMAGAPLIAPPSEAVHATFPVPVSNARTLLSPPGANSRPPAVTIK